MNFAFTSKTPTVSDGEISKITFLNLKWEVMIMKNGGADAKSHIQYHQPKATDNAVPRFSILKMKCIRLENTDPRQGIDCVLRK